MKISRIATILTATVSSACSFYVLTRSGLAGTLVGAAVAGTVYNLTSQGLTHGLDAGKDWLKRRAGSRTESAAANPPEDSTPSNDRQRTSATRQRSLQELVRWAPAALGVVALGLSVSAVLGPHPAPQVVTERVVAQPVIQEKVIVEERTVTVTVPVLVADSPAANNGPSAGGGEVTTPTTDTHAVPGSSTSTTSAIPPSTETTTPPTTAPPTAPPTTSPSGGDPTEGSSSPTAN